MEVRVGRMVALEEQEALAAHARRWKAAERRRGREWMWALSAVLLIVLGVAGITWALIYASEVTEALWR